MYNTNKFVRLPFLGASLLLQTDIIYKTAGENFVRNFLAIRYGTPIGSTTSLQLQTCLLV